VSVLVDARSVQAVTSFAPRWTPLKVGSPWEAKLPEREGGVKPRPERGRPIPCIVTRVSRRSRSSGSPIVRVLIVLVVVAAAAFGLSELDVAGEFLESSGTQSGWVPAEPSRVLQGLEVAPPGSMSGYSREKFPHWSDADEFGWRGLPDDSCDVRDAALIRDGKNVRVAEGCDVISGR
jgi:hypothetical protein